MRGAVTEVYLGEEGKAISVRAAVLLTCGSGGSKWRGHQQGNPTDHPPQASSALTRRPRLQAPCNVTGQGTGGGRVGESGSMRLGQQTWKGSVEGDALGARE